MHTTLARSLVGQASGMVPRARWLPAVVGTIAVAVGCGGDSPGALTTAHSDLTSCATGATLRGVDVSSYEGTINWDAARASGITFGFTKATEGLTVADGTFEANWAGMRAAGVVRGAYHFFHPGDSATAQASFVLSTVGTLDANDLPIVLDFEVLDSVPEATAVANAVTFLRTVTAATGKTAILYMSSEFLSRSYPALAPYTLWVANYGVSCPLMPSGWSSWRFWQNADNGVVGGISGTTDTDEFNGSLAEFTALFGGSGTATASDAGTSAPSDAGTGTGTDAGTVAPEDAGSVTCTLAGAIYGQDTCTETLQCDSGTWVVRSIDPSGCSMNIAPAGACLTDSGTLVPQDTCTPTLQCDAGVWVDRMVDPAACLGSTTTSCDLGGATWPQNTCTETLQCDSGSWIARPSDPTSCNTDIAPSGACLTDTGTVVPQNTCTSTLQCDASVWVSRSSDPSACL